LLIPRLHPLTSCSRMNCCNREAASRNLYRWPSPTCYRRQPPWRYLAGVARSAGYGWRRSRSFWLDHLERGRGRLARPLHHTARKRRARCLAAHCASDIVKRQRKTWSWRGGGRTCLLGMAGDSRRGVAHRLRISLDRTGRDWIVGGFGWTSDIVPSYDRACG